MRPVVFHGRRLRSIPLVRRYLPSATPAAGVNIHLHPHARDGGNALSCPRCGEQNLHRNCVTVFDRNEDGEKLTKTTIERDVTVKTVRAHESANPSYRRHGLAIRFWCEGCQQTSELTIEQHKGHSFLGWR
jgi:hypothetical protein